MSSLLLCGAVIVFWLYIYYKHSKSRRNGSSLLPVTTRSEDAPIEGSLWNAKLGTSTLSIELAGFLLLRCWTNLYVEKGRKLEATLTSDSSDSTGRDRFSRYSHADSKLLTAFYNLGSFIAFAGQIVTVVVLWWSAVLLFGRYYRFFVPDSSATSALVKRGLAAFPSRPANDIQTLNPRLLIPGLNIPLSHIYPIVIALLICTGIHEYGHAVTASLENIPLTRWGYNLFAIIPAAFVELVPPKEQHPISRIRVASSGVFHNFITAAILFTLSSFLSGEHLLPYVGYKPLENGVKVIGFAEDSPLSQHIPTGAIITQIDDSHIKGYFEITTVDSWSNILLNHREIAGWCLQSSILHARFGSCCYLESTLASENGTCFTSSDETENGCIDPLGMMEDSSWPRCDSNIDCSDNQLCTQPHSSTSLVRIIFNYPNEERSRTVVWNGPKQEVWEQIIVDNFDTRLFFLPNSLPYWLSLLMEYINTVSLSLFFLNLLPIRALDGGELFLAIAELISLKSWTAGSIDLESGSLSRTSHIPTYHAKSILIFFERTTIILASSLAINSFLPL